MKLTEITDPTDTPILINIIRRKLAKGERVWLDCTLDASNDLGMEGTHDKYRVDNGRIFEAHDARRCGGDSNPSVKNPNRLFIEIEYEIDVDPNSRGPGNGNQIAAIWADEFDTTFTLVPASPSPSWILTNDPQ
jgi:hypothetical protein